MLTYMIAFKEQEAELWSTLQEFCPGLAEQCCRW